MNMKKILKLLLAGIAVIIFIWANLYKGTIGFDNPIFSKENILRTAVFFIVAGFVLWGLNLRSKK